MESLALRVRAWTGKPGMRVGVAFPGSGDSACKQGGLDSRSFVNL